MTTRRRMFGIETGRDGEHEIHIKMSASDALFLATRFLNQLDMKDPTQPVVAIFSGTVEEVL